VQAYHDINRSLGSFYEKPREDTEKERLREEVEELKMRIDERDNRKSAVDEQIELLERSFQMASKYMPTGTDGTNGTAGTNAVATTTTTIISNVSEKTAVVHVDRVSERTVSAILPEISNAEFINMYSKPRNMGFRTVTDNANQGMKNTFSACIHSDQTIMDGQNVRLRLLEAMQVGNIVIPQNTAVTGVAKIQGERRGISVVSLEHAGTVIPVELRAYDLDGQQGIFIPNMAELSAVKEIVANMGTSAGTSINLSTDAGKQFAADMGRNAIQGVSQFTAKKLREVKVHLKADYRIFLLPKEN
jgi:conjugative transposon TraM protein